MSDQNFAQFLRKYIVRSGESVFYFRAQSEVLSGQIYRYLSSASMPSSFMLWRILEQIMRQEGGSKQQRAMLLLEAHEAIRQSMIERGQR